MLPIVRFHRLHRAPPFLRASVRLGVNFFVPASLCLSPFLSVFFSFIAYFSGKMLAKMGRIALIAEEMGRPDDARMVAARLAEASQVWLCAVRTLWVTSFPCARREKRPTCSHNRHGFHGVIVSSTSRGTSTFGTKPYAVLRYEFAVRESSRKHIPPFRAPSSRLDGSL